MDFTIPAFCAGYDTEEILDRMVQRIPIDIDASEGSHPYNLEAPVAYEISYLMQFVLPEAMKLIFPMFCEDYDDILDYHASTRGLKRKEAHYAVGTILITGEPNTEIPQGTIFSTVSVNDEASIEFQTTDDAIIGEDGTVEVPIQAVDGGTSGNVPAGTIIISDNSIDDITSVTNNDATSGGLEQESNESLQQRIIERDLNMDVSYGGSPSDFKRWALEVSGTGSAIIVSPEDDTTPIQIILTDSSGNPASETMCTEVYNHIMSPDDENLRLAPINSRIEVIPPATMEIAVSATVELSTGLTVETIKSAFVEAIQKYIPEASDDGEVRYSKVFSILSKIDGVEDHKNLTINGATSNLAIPSTKIPRITDANVTLTKGTV